MRFKWTIEIEVDEIWVADGFDITCDQTIQDMMMRLMPYATSQEVNGRLLSHPPNEAVAKVQGYKSVEEYLMKRKAR